jgi:hypothetical protein
MGPGCPEKVDWEFISWIWAFPFQEKPKIMHQLGKYSGIKDIFILHSDREVNILLRSINHGNI